MSDDSREDTIDLMSRIKAGDIEARYRLLERAVPPLRSWARGKLPRWARSLADTQDLVQNVVARTLPRLGVMQVESADTFQAFLKTALKNQIIDEIRKARLRTRDDAALEQQADPAPPPVQVMLTQEDMGRYERALQTLEPAEREMIRARHEDKDYAEIARIFGKPTAAAARMAVNRAIAKLAKAMLKGH
jgi:RNA polymerase sigma-70 factor (ECF subfamily)